MSVQITGKYIGKLGTEITHGPSGTVIKTAAPVDNNGDGSSFSPTDLCASAIASCMMTIIAIKAEHKELSVDGMNFSLEKHMNQSPRHIASVPITINLPNSISEKDRVLLEKSAMACPVHKSIASYVDIPVTFNYF